METRPTCKECGAPLAADAPEGLCPKCLLKVAMGTQAGTQPPDPVGSGAKAKAHAELPDPARLAEYFPQLEILELLGQGGMGAVYKARQSGLDRLVALKILPLQASGDTGFAERFNREARALAKLSHPNIVAVYDFGQTHGLHYFIMEYVDGPNLREIERSGKLSTRQALQIIPYICEALQFAHDEGVVHRDVKPENVLLDKKGRVKIADFGLAKILGRGPKDTRLTGVRDVMGTPHYMAPEQVEHPQEVDHRADIYSLGVVFYEMLTGELPLGKFAPPSQKVQVDVRLDEVVLHTLEKEPSRRYQHASQVKTDLETIARSEASPSTPRPAEPGVTPAPARVGTAWRGLAILAGAVILVLVTLLVRRDRPQLEPRPNPAEPAAPAALASPIPTVPPVVIKTVPESGSAGVDPSLTELRVTFSKPMRDRSWSWCYEKLENFPDANGQPRYLADGRTCVQGVKLQPGKVYAIWLNTDRSRNFQDQSGLPAVPYLLIFETRK
jgi:serine/threonine protein kinase